MIFTITPNPALDLGGMVENLVPDEKSYIHHETRFPGGNAINAARVIKKFDQPVVAGGFLGGGIGLEIESLLKKEKVSCRFIRIQGSTRVNVTVSNAKTHLQTRLSFPGPTILPTETRALINWVRKLPSPSLIVIGGSLPPGFPVRHLKHLIQVSNKKRNPCIIDVPGSVLRELVNSKPFLIKPNLTEFQELTGKKPSSISDVIREAKKINSKIPFICVSSVEDGALLVTPEKVWFGTIPKVKVKTTVGAGDSMVGAMSARIWNSDQPSFDKGEDLLRWGLAAATATLTTQGTSLGEYRKIIQYYNKVKIREIR